MKTYLGSVVIILIATAISVSRKCPGKNWQRILYPPQQEGELYEYPSYVPVREPKLVEKCRKKGEVAGRATDKDCENVCLDFVESHRTARDCHFMPRERCFCPKGQVRINEDEGAKCVQVEHCPGMRPRFNPSLFPSEQEDERHVSLRYVPVRDPKLVEKCRKKGEVAGRATTVRCDTSCLALVENHPIRHCRFMPRERCFCPKGQVRLNEDDGAKCVQREQCSGMRPRFNPSLFPSEQEDKDAEPLNYVPVRDPKLVEKCRKKGEVAGRAKTLYCETSCENSIKSSRQAPNCTLSPRKRCFCPKGKVRKNFDLGACVTKDHCVRFGPEIDVYFPVRDPKLVEECRKKGEMAGRDRSSRCDTSCLDYTESRRTPRDCPFMPQERCFCPKGQVRISDDDGAKCVQAERCPGMRPRF